MAYKVINLDADKRTAITNESAMNLNRSRNSYLCHEDIVLNIKILNHSWTTKAVHFPKMIKSSLHWIMFTERCFTLIRIWSCFEYNFVFSNLQCLCQSYRCKPIESIMDCKDLLSSIASHLWSYFSANKMNQQAFWGNTLLLPYFQYS